MIPAPDDITDAAKFPNIAQALAERAKLTREERERRDREWEA